MQPVILIVFHKSFGHHTYAKKQKVRNTDIYDLASLTKILGTMPMVLKAYDDRKFNLNSAVTTLIPDWKNTNKEGLSRPPSDLVETNWNQEFF